eukprot:TRINITY_DN9702_c0_g1_i13.p2 TRINITY_DN9702_c0_g1~~TRINITY_DN9702_c0_g1_i13.p2  ORF type:complete len:149 (+),score=19.17 TRINITY_DN9702_c0_g1_i13:226-672(+)
MNNKPVPTRPFKRCVTTSDERAETKSVKSGSEVNMKSVARVSKKLMEAVKIETDLHVGYWRCDSFDTDDSSITDCEDPVVLPQSKIEIKKYQRPAGTQSYNHNKDPIKTEKIYEIDEKTIHRENKRIYKRPQRRDATCNLNAFIKNAS